MTGLSFRDPGGRLTVDEDGVFRRSLLRRRIREPECVQWFFGPSNAICRRTKSSGTQVVSKSDKRETTSPA